MTACNQAKEMYCLKDEIDRIHDSIATAFPWLGEDDINVVDVLKEDCRDCVIYEHEGYNCDIYTDGLIFNSKNGKSIKDFGFGFILDRDVMNKISKIEFILSSARKEAYADMLDPGVLALMV